MSKVASDNVISGKETIEETLEETPVDLEVVKDNLEEISKKVQNIENRLSEEQENIGKIIESVGEIRTEITATENMLVESPKGNIQTKQNSPIYFLGIVFVIIIFWIVGCLLERLINKIKSWLERLINGIKSGLERLINGIKSWLERLINGIKSWLERINKKIPGRKWLINIIIKVQKRVRKPRNSEGQIREYTKLSAEDIFDQFRKKYKEKDKKWIIVIVMIILSYFIMPLLYLQFVKWFRNYKYFSSLLMIGPAVSCLAVLSNKKFKKIPNIPALVLCIWLVMLSLFYIDDIELDGYIILLISLFYYSIFLFSIIHFQYTSFKDCTLSEAYKTINAIIKNNSIIIAQDSFDMLVLSSSKIENDVIEAIKSVLSFLGTLGIISFTKKYFNAYIKNLLENDTLDSIVTMIASLIILLPIFYFLYRDFKWKADLYKKVLKDMQFTYTLKGKLDYDEK